MLSRQSASELATLVLDAFEQHSKLPAKEAPSILAPADIFRSADIDGKLLEIRRSIIDRESVVVSYDKARNIRVFPVKEDGPLIQIY